MNDPIPTITVLIISHGEDLINDRLTDIGKNIRVLSRAGIPGCYGICGITDYKEIFDKYENLKTIPESLSSYKKLETIYNFFLTTNQCHRLEKTITKYSKDTKKGKFSINLYKKKKHSKLFKPIIDHKYYFNDDSINFKDKGIHVVEIENQPQNSNLDYKDNLIEKKFKLDEYTNYNLKRFYLKKKN